MPTYTERDDNRFFWTGRQLGHAIIFRHHPKSNLRARWKCTCGVSGKYQAVIFARGQARSHIHDVIKEHRATSGD